MTTDEHRCDGLSVHKGRFCACPNPPTWRWSEFRSDGAKGQIEYTRHYCDEHKARLERDCQETWTRLTAADSP